MMSKRGKAFDFAVYAQGLFWVVLFVMLMFSFINTGSGLGAGVIAAALLLGCHMINFYIVYGWLTPRYFEKRRYYQFAIGLLLLLVLLTPLRMWVENNFIHRPFLVVRGRRLRGLVIFSEISICCFAFLFRMAVDSQLHIRKASEIERLQLQTELKFLKFQMHPHFLFNTINNVYSLSLSGSARTPEALLRLSGLLRYLLYECNHRVSFSRELQALESYIDLFQLRYEEPLNIRIQTRVRRMERLIEPMLLIPLLENAIKHSGIGVDEGAWIAIDIREEGGGLLAAVRNSRRDGGGELVGQEGRGRMGEAVEIEPEAGGIGLQNIRKRLEMLGPGHSLRDLVINEGEDVFEVELKIPGI